jgi:[NiFe] hydrogenase diaphorase moiety small subunit
VSGATIRVDGVAVTAKPGQTIIAACDDSDVYVPRLCYRADLPSAGHCRLCTCVVGGRHVAACVTPATDGMVVDNASPALVAQRELLLEMLFVEGDHPCPFCEKSGDCDLQALAYRFGISDMRFAYRFPKREIDATHPDIFLDRNPCIQCGLCVRASHELDKKTIFGFENRGEHFRIVVDAPAGLGGTGIESSDRAASACPVGALVIKRTEYAVPYGERRFDRTPIGIDRA